MSHPHILLTVGAWHTPEAWEPVQSRLKAAGFESTAIPMPSVGASPSHYDMTEDVAAIRAATTSLVEQGKDVVVVLHSYGGQPGSEAMKGLGKVERAEQGLSGGVIRLVFIMAYIVPEGFQPAQRDDFSAAPDWMVIDKEARPSKARRLHLANSVRQIDWS